MQCIIKIFIYFISFIDKKTIKLIYIVSTKNCSFLKTLFLLVENIKQIHENFRYSSATRTKHLVYKEKKINTNAAGSGGFRTKAYEFN